MSDLSGGIREALSRHFEPATRTVWERLLERDLGGREPREVLRSDLAPGVSIPGYGFGDGRPRLSPLSATETEIVAWLPVSSRTAADLERTAGVGVKAACLHADEASPEVLRCLRDLGGAAAHPLRLHLDAGRITRELLDSVPSLAPLLESATLDPFADGLFADALFAEQGQQDAAPFRAIDAASLGDRGADPVTWLAYLYLGAAEWLERQSESSAFASGGQGSEILVTLPVDTPFFQSVAAIRAARIGLSRLADRSGNPPGRFGHLRARPSRWAWSPVDRDLNLLRATTMGASAILGGADAFELPPHALEDPDAVRLALNVQLLLRHESKLHLVADPAAGSYAIEDATDALGAAAWDRFEQYWKKGALRSQEVLKHIRQDIAESARQDVQRIRSKDRIVVGANRFADATTEPGPSPEGPHRLQEVVQLRAKVGVQGVIGVRLLGESPASLARLAEASDALATAGISLEPRADATALLCGTDDEYALYADENSSPFVACGQASEASPDAPVSWLSGSTPLWPDLASTAEWLLACQERSHD